MPKIYQARTAGGKNRAHHKYKKNNYSDDGLPSSWIQYKQTVRHRYILFVFMVSSGFLPPAARAKYILGLRM